MRRFTLTSQHLKGHVEAIYDNTGVLCRIDFTNGEVTPKMVYNYKNTTPVKVDQLYESFKETGVTVEEKEFEATFEDFKREYPYKRNTHLAEKYWPKLTSSQQHQAYTQAIEYRKYCSRHDWYTPMLPEKWLKTEQFKNPWSKL